MFKGIISDVLPTSVDDISAITSLGRPGPLTAGMPKQYADRKNGREEVVPLLRGAEKILKDTYGLAITKKKSWKLVNNVLALMLINPTVFLERL
jgi:DNA polymerase-3 subunit alpha